MTHRTAFLWLVLLGACQPPKARVAPRDPTPPVHHAALAFLSPRPGDTLVEGRSYVIRWTTPGGMTVDLGAAMGGKDRGMLLTSAPSTVDSLVWMIPVGYVTGFGPRSSDQMRLRLTNADSSDQWVEVGPFTIRGDPTP